MKTLFVCLLLILGAASLAAAEQPAADFRGSSLYGSHALRLHKGRDPQPSPVLA